MNHSQNMLSLAVVIICITLGPARGAGHAPQGGSAQDGKIERIYDQAKDVTTLRLSPMQVYGEPLASSNYKGADEARFYASFTYRGNALSGRPQRVLISLISTSEDWKYTDFRNSIALVDGEQLKLGGLVWLPSFSISSRANSVAGDYTEQEITISLPLKMFLRIAHGKEVKIRMGPREFKLNENHLEALREITNRWGTVKLKR